MWKSAWPGAPPIAICKWWGLDSTATENLEVLNPKIPTLAKAARMGHPALCELLLCSYIYGVIIKEQGPVRMGRNQGQVKRAQAWRAL